MLVGHLVLMCVRPINFACKAILKRAAVVCQGWNERDASG